MAAPTAPEQDQRSSLERFLAIFTEVRAGEGVTALLMALNVLLLLTAYYVIKPVREALILAMESGAEYKAYMGGAIAIALLFAVPAYAKVAGRQQRNRLVVGVTLFFISHLVIFYGLSSVEATRPYLGLLFYLWVGVFNMMVVAQFWAFAADIYVEEQGNRLFPMIGIGASTGAVFGSWVSGILIEPLGLYEMLLLAGGLLGLCALLSQIIHVRATKESAVAEAKAEAEADDKDKEEAPPAAKPKDDIGPYALVFKYRYLTLLAVFSLTFTWVNTNGEYILGKLIKENAVETAKETTDPSAASAWLAEPKNKEAAQAYHALNGDEFEGTFEATKTEVATAIIRREKAGSLIGQTYSNFFFWVNLLGVFLQMFVVSRLIKYAGFKVSFFILPVIAMADAIAVLIVPVLAVLRVGKTAENATDYSLNNTLRNMLWLPTTKAMKYKAKQAVDTFFVRMGDVASGVLVFVLAAQLGLGVRGFAAANVILVALWLVVAVAIVREQVKLKRMREAGEFE